MKHSTEISRFIKDGDFEVTDGGILVHGAINIAGKYFHSVNGEDEQADHNLLPAAGILHILDVAFGQTAKSAAWYLSVFSGNVTPISTWTAANYVANATENVSTTEGYSGANRPAWTPSVASACKIGNLSSRAVFNIVCSSSIALYGAALLNTQARGATTGVLASASRFAVTRTLSNGDVFELGYEVELTDS